MNPDEIEALDESLRRRFRVVDEDVAINERTFRIAHPASAEELISEEDFERDERLPYWAELWPSARVLATTMLEMPGHGRSLLELGCGAGLVTTCAAAAGFDVTASDYYIDAARFACVNAWRNADRIVSPVHLDWRSPGDVDQYDVVIASDVLYERPYGPLVAQVIGATLKADGFALVTDPGRVGRESFLGALGAHGLSVASERAEAYAEGKIRQKITLYEVRRTN